MFLLSFDDAVIRSLSRIEERLDFAREDAEELEEMLGQQKLAKRDSEVLWARFRAVGSLVLAINNAKQQTLAVLDPERQSTDA